MAANFIPDLQNKLGEFAGERDWEQFHTPKNLAMALTVEAAELQEIFQWLSAEQSQQLTEEIRTSAAREMADVLLYLVRMADVLDIDLEQAAWDKLNLNAGKYPVEKARGNADKYSTFKPD